MSYRRLEELEEKQIEQYLQTKALIFLEAAVNNLLDVFDIQEAMNILDDQLDMIEETNELERKYRERNDFKKFTRPEDDDDDGGVE